MEALVLTGGRRLAGEIRVAGAKNSVLKLMAAALLTDGITKLHDVPRVAEVGSMARLLRQLGCGVTEDDTSRTLDVSVPAELEHKVNYNLVRQLRASLSVLGPLVARGGRADIALPGGDNIGSRGIDMHLAGLERMGASVRTERGYLIVESQGRLRGAQLWLDFPSVGATETLLMASVLAEGATQIDNAAREPEVQDLASMLLAMGAQIDGIGTSTLTVEGVQQLRPTTHTVVPDRLVASTWAVAATMTRGDVTIRNARPEHQEIVLDKLAHAGATIELVQGGFRVHSEARARAVDLVTLPYPGFPTDVMPMFLALNTTAIGAAMVTENLFEARFRLVNELVRLGADVRTDGHHAMVRGKEVLSGAPVEAPSLREGAALVLAGLVAQGQTTIFEPQLIYRGYESIVETLVGLGADAALVDVDPEQS